MNKTHCNAMALPSRNVEIKARVRDFKELVAKAKELGKNDAIVLHQKDTFYYTPIQNGRLKLREENGTSTLISYDRPNTEGPKLSKYVKCEVSDPSALSAVLGDALGVKGQVRKERFLFIVGQTRVHVDQVAGLGNFMELEVMLTKDQSVEEGQQIANHLMLQLGICEEDLLSGAYMEMLLKQDP